MYGGLVQANIELYTGIDNVVELTLDDGTSTVNLDGYTLTAVFKRHVDDRTPVLTATLSATGNMAVLTLTAEQLKAVGRIPSHGALLYYDIVQEVGGQTNGIAFGRAYVMGGIR